MGAVIPGQHQLCKDQQGMHGPFLARFERYRAWCLEHDERAVFFPGGPEALSDVEPSLDVDDGLISTIVAIDALGCCAASPRPLDVCQLVLDAGFEVGRIALSRLIASDEKSGPERRGVSLQPALQQAFAIEQAPVLTCLSQGVLVGELSE